MASTASQNLLIASIYLLCIVFFGLHLLPSDELFQFMPKIFNWIGIRRFWWRPQPIAPLESKKALTNREVCLGSLSCMYRSSGQKLLIKGKRVSLDLCVERGSHYPIENTHACSSPDAYSSPDVHFDRMFCLLID